MRLEVVYPALRQLRRYAPDLADDLGGVLGYHLVPKRWILERSSWRLGRQRRLNKDDERQAGSGEAFPSLIGIRLLLARLARG